MEETITSTDPVADRPLAVSEREREVLMWLAQGVSPQEVAHRLKRHQRAVRARVKALLERLGVSTPAEALQRIDGQTAVESPPADPDQVD
jgi:DNA-binding NarL/FixJ family response regulator